MPGRPSRALLEAIERGDPALVRRVLGGSERAGEAIEIEGEAMHAAAERGPAEVVSLLLDAGGDPNARDADGRTPLHAVSDLKRAEQAERVVQVLVAGGADVRASDRDGWLPIHEAAFSGNEAVVSALLAAGAEVETQKTAGGASALALAARMGRAKVVTALIAAGADPCAEGGLGAEMAIALACVSRHAAQVIEAAIAAAPEAIARGRNRNGESLLHAVVRRERLADLIEPLLAVGIDVNVRDARGVTPLMCAAQSAAPSCVQRLLAAGGDVGASDEGGWQALHYAAAGARRRCVEHLLAAGADPAARTARGERPADLAAFAAPELARMLAASCARRAAGRTRGPHPGRSAAALQATI